MYSFISESTPSFLYHTQKRLKYKNLLQKTEVKFEAMVSDRVIAGDEDLGLWETLESLIRCEDRRDQFTFVDLAVSEAARARIGIKTALQKGER